ncbi:MobQ family relaxase [Halobacillus seohaensis]|uniref:MobQ family relaxase n=1 Tax=Halobacillus seohaensis TaxID=447421 RepID=A0ABW2EPF2_9BACI
MAIYHFSAQMISRSKGQSAVAASAYRSGERLHDERTGETKYYQRDIQPETMILSPSHSPAWVNERERLWNEVEKAENRKNSQLAREINIAIPHELSHAQQDDLIHDFVQKQFVHQGMIADVAIHRDDPNNPHAHVMLTTREISEDGFTKKNRDWNDRNFIQQWREQWSEQANHSLEKEGFEERISHLSHEERGFEQQPTVHLGHVAHEMENRGVETDRGNINRDRQAYNQVVVDLQTYREEKKALEQEKARKEQEAKKVASFNTPQERIHLQQASHVLKTEPTLSNIAERMDQLDQWKNRLENNSQYLRWKDTSIKEASDQYRWMHSFTRRMGEEQRRIEEINWMNPLKVKENRAIKDKSEKQIAHFKEEIAHHDQKLNDYREKLGFKNEQGFRQIENNYKQERPKQMDKNMMQRRTLNQERKTLQDAQRANENSFVRRVAARYPDRPEMDHMSFKIARALDSVNTHFNKVISIDSMEQHVKHMRGLSRKLHGQINDISQETDRLEQCEGYLKNYQKAQELVGKYQNDPILKGKRVFSKSHKQEYNNALSERDTFAKLLKQNGVEHQADLAEQQSSVSKMTTQLPQFQEKAEQTEKESDFFGAILEGIEQAGRAMEHHQSQREKKLQRGKGKDYGLER